MNVRNLLPVFAAASLAVLLQSQPGWSADHGIQPRRPAVSRCMLAEPLAEDQNVKAPMPAEEPDSPETAYCNAKTCAPDDCSCMYECPRGCVYPHTQLFGEFLYLRALNASVEYGVPINGPISLNTIPIERGRTAAVNPDFSPGFRVGGAFWLDECSTLSLTYSHYENNVDDHISVNPPLVIYPMVVHPSTLNASQFWLDARAHQSINFDLGDLDFRHVFYSNECTSINYLAGIRYASLKQRFDSQFESIIVENVNTDVNFEGGGFRLGLEAERNGGRNLSVYGKASASFLGGEFHGSYLQSSVNAPVVVQTDWKEARFVSILDCEIGIGWTSCNGRVRASAGYLVSSWMNVVKSAEFISAVQANKYHGPDKISGNGLVFDGFVAHVELGW